MDTFACSQVQQFIIAILDLAVILKIQFRLQNMINNNTFIQFKKIFYNSCPAKLVYYFICSFAASSCCSLRVVKQRKISIVTQSTSSKLSLRLVHGNERKTFATKDKSHLKEYPEFFFPFFFFHLKISILNTITGTLAIVMRQNKSYVIEGRAINFKEERRNRMHFFIK